MNCRITLYVYVSVCACMCIPECQLGNILQELSTLFLRQGLGGTWDLMTSQSTHPPLFPSSVLEVQADASMSDFYVGAGTWILSTRVASTLLTELSPQAPRIVEILNSVIQNVCCYGRGFLSLIFISPLGWVMCGLAPSLVCTR